MVFRCNKCVKVFSTRPELHQHHEVDHGRVKLAEMQGGKYPCPRCTSEFLSKSMLVNHSRDHKENVYGCNECSVKICHLCHRIFVSDDKLFDHMKETHQGSTGCTREELIEDE